MTSLLRVFSVVCVGMAAMLGDASPLHAQNSCKITGLAAAAITPAVPAGSLSTTSVNIVSATLNVSFTSSGGGGSKCGVAVQISGSLNRVGGGGTASYSITTTGPTTGGSTISYTTTIGGSADVTPATISIPVNLVIPAGAYANGTYTDVTAVLRVINQNTGAVIASAAIVPTLITTATACTIGGVANAGTQTLDFSSSPIGATITTGVKVASFGTASCNAPTTITLTSSQGAAKAAANGTSSHQNFFNYTATVTLNGATATLNTASNPAVAGAETATAKISASSTNAALSVQIQPSAPAKPLVGGTYNDTLTVMLTPD